MSMFNRKNFGTKSFHLGGFYVKSLKCIDLSLYLGFPLKYLTTRSHKILQLPCSKGTSMLHIYIHLIDTNT